MADDIIHNPAHNPATGPFRPGTSDQIAPSPVSPGRKAPVEASPNGVESPQLKRRHGPIRAVLAFLYPKHEATGQHSDGIREVVETVVFVVVLVLMLKAFVAEAFVIPTGSMAETLYGYQRIVTCEKCKFTYPVNFSTVVDPQNGTPEIVNSCVCPNCRYETHLAEARAHDDPKWNSDLAKEVDDSRTGDRVLVAKFWNNSFFGMTPNRFDTVVFKFPQGPQKNHIPINYIKRLIGLGGETIGIHYGKLYVLPAANGPHYDDSAVDPKNLWMLENVHENDQIERLKKRDGFEILRKPPKTILSVMKSVYDNDFPASDMTNSPRWGGLAGKTAWATDGSNGFKHDNSNEGFDFLRYQHVLRDIPGKRQLITDFMGYNSGKGPGHVGPPPQNWVSDLILECEATVENASGQLALELSKGPDRFQARWDLSTGVCSLVRHSRGKAEEILASKSAPLSKGKHKLRFANVDDRLTVWVGNKLPFEDGVPYASAYKLNGDNGPVPENDLEPASIGVKQAAVALEHVKLYRDTYYTISPGPGDANIRDWSDDTAWDDLRNLACKTIYVQPGHSLCLGDNSPESSDGRSWGLVPDRLMLGRALLVYFPFGRAGRIR